MAGAGYLVQYGRSAFLGRFVPAGTAAFARDDRVVVRSPRGLEIGTVLCEAEERFAAQAGPHAAGELLRPAGAADDADVLHAGQRGEQVLADAQRLASESGLPLLFVDVEVMLDGEQAILHAVHWAECDASALCAELSTHHRMTVKVQDDTRAPVAETPSHGCGKPDCGGGGCTSCGSGDGGCSTGGCSRGSVKSANELTAYFSQLRQQMETHQHQQRFPLG